MKNGKIYCRMNMNALNFIEYIIKYKFIDNNINQCIFLIKLIKHH